jgi:hypothetical protein
MTTTKKETRGYLFYNKFGKEEYMYVTYSLVFKGERLETVYNTAHGDWGHSVQRDSEVWDYFNKKYN